MMRSTYLNLVLIIGSLGGCQAGIQASLVEGSGQKPAEEEAETPVSGAKLTNPDCSDPDLSKVIKGVEFMLCDGSIGAGTLELTAAIIKSGIEIAGVTGSYAGDDFENCSSDGELGCVTADDFKAANTASFTDADIRASITIGGVAGSLVGAPAACSADGQLNCLSNASYRAADTTGLASKVLNSQTVALVGGNVTLPAVADVKNAVDYGVSGTGSRGSYVPDFPDVGNVRDNDTVDDNAGALADCSSDGDTSCVSVADFPAVDKVNKLDGGWNVRVGDTVGGVAGKLKVNCRNMVGYYDGAAGYTGGSSVLHTVDDYNYNGTGSGDFPSTNPWDSDYYFCGYSSTPEAERTWERVTTDPVTAGVNSVYKDKITALNWTQGTVADTSKDWDEALEYCADLDLASAGYGGKTGWRLPTQKELQAAYTHGIHDLDNDHTATDNLGDLDQAFWSASTQSVLPSFAWNVYLYYGSTANNDKTGGFRVLCVAP